MSSNLVKMLFSIMDYQTARVYYNIDVESRAIRSIMNDKKRRALNNIRDLCNKEFITMLDLFGTCDDYEYILNFDLIDIFYDKMTA